MPVIIMMPVMVFRKGEKETATRDTAASAAITVRITSSRAWGLRASKRKKKGSISSMMIMVLMR